MVSIRRFCIQALECHIWIAFVLLSVWGLSVTYALTERRNAMMKGNILIGALFPVHRQPSMKTAYTRQCGEIWEQYGMHRIEVFLKTLDEINNDDSILPNITLGCDIRDSCWYPPVALEQSIDFIKNSIASRERELNKTGQASQESSTLNKPIAGLIGPGSSTVTIQVQNLLSLFNIPQVGYSATSKDLSDKSLYKYFLRVVPSDKLQARALVDLVLYYNWTYISTVYTEGNYGFRGMLEFQAMAEEAGLCTGTEEKVENNAADASFDRVIEGLMETPNARVVICFCEGMTVRGLFLATKRKGVAGRFLIIGSDGWAVRPDVVDHIENQALGGISIKLYSPPIMDFDQYYYSLKPYTNHRNPWFNEFWQQKFKCRLDGPDADYTYSTRCTGDEDLSFEYVQDAKLGFVINAIYTMAYALDSMRRDLCKDEPGMCSALDPVNGRIFLDYLVNVSFVTYSNNRIHFNQNGDPPGRYDIMNFQRAMSPGGNYTYDYVRIGGWDNGNLTMDDNKIFWPIKALDGASVLESVCSKPCPRGQIKVPQDRAHCCWVCTLCKENEFMVDESMCKQCPLGWWPNENLTACLMIPIEFMQWDDKEAVVSIAFACVGIFATMWVTLVFIRHNNTAVVKASTRELSYIILLGVGISYVTTFPLVAKPSLFTCYLARILPGFSFSLIYGALVTKTNRIARILAGSKKKIMTRKPRFMSASAQVVITCILIGVECAIITVMLILEAADSKLDFPSKRRVKLTCNVTTMGIIVPLGFDAFLIVMCTLYAIKTRNLPENFNEAKFIGFTMYTTCIIWLAFVPIYFGSDSKVITMCLAITLSATVALILLFFPKIYIIICKPERNNRSAFTTSKDVRCHIGSTGGRSLSNDSFDRLELLLLPPTKNDAIVLDNLLDNLSPISLSLEDIRIYSGKAKSKSTISLFTSWKTGNVDQASHHLKHHIQAKESSPRLSSMPPPKPAKSDDNLRLPKHDAWHEKTFENAALALYRQKSFFNRWKSKSGNTESASSNAQSRYKPGYTGSGNRPGSRVATSHISNQNPKLNHKDPRSRGYSRSGGTQCSNPTYSPNKSKVRRNPSLKNIGFQRRLSLEYIDSAVQTDIDLIESYVSTLRRRTSSKVSNSSVDSAICNGTVVILEPTDLHRESGTGRVVTVLNDTKHNNLHSYSACVQHPAADPDVEMDRLLKTPAPDGTLESTSRSSSQAYSMMGQSPLLPGSERSPLLGSSGYMCDDTTSDDSLSDNCDPGDPDDLEELLLEAGEYQGSFSSVSSNSANTRWNPPSKRRMSDTNSQVRVVPDRAYCSYHNPATESDIPQRVISVRKHGHERRGPVPLGMNQPRPDARLAPLPLYRYEDRCQLYDTNATLSSTAIPQIRVKHPTPQTSESEQLSEVTGSSSSFRTNFSGLTSSVGDSGHPMTASPDSRRTSTTESSVSEDQICSDHSSPTEEQPKQTLKKEDSVTKFQEYLRTRGVDLDLATVQSSDV